MTDARVSPFDTLESAYGFIGLLTEAVDEEAAAIFDEITLAQSTPGADRRLDALRLVHHKLKGLRHHVRASHVLLNDLRMLKRLLVGEGRGEES
jgi:hypothetical protein